MISRHTINNLPGLLEKSSLDNTELLSLTLTDQHSLLVYPKSARQLDETIFFIGKQNFEKYFCIASPDAENAFQEKFTGEHISDTQLSDDYVVKICGFTHENAEALRSIFDFTNPVLIGVQNSYGLGDRLGLANPGHLRAIRDLPLKPVLAQQSIRELERTHRTPEEVMDTASWAVFQEGFTDGFGADADHLKTTEDIDYTIKAGFTMFTFDPGDYVVNEADTLPADELENRANQLPWDRLEDTLDECLRRYADRDVQISSDFTIEPTREEVLRGLIKYGEVIAHAVYLYRYLSDTYPDYPREVELSVDETESVTQPFEHYLVANELQRRNVQLISLAPRFVGDFEKGIDYKGDLNLFKEEYIKHLKIAEKLGPYKISVHSGSDKFSVYNVIGSLDQGYVHVKTAGTSYLEALRTIAAVRPQLFREILDYSRELFPTEKRSYHVTADLTQVPAGDQISDEDLVALFDSSRVHARQVLHVTFGKVLTDRDEQGHYRFRDGILYTLREHEETHYAYLQNHFQRHFEPFL